MKRKVLIGIFILLFCFNAKAQWTRISNDTMFYYTSVWFLNKDTGFVCGQDFRSPYNGIIVRTKDGGSSWDTTRTGTLFFMTIQFVNDTVGYVSGQDGDILRTYDMGNSWQSLNSCFVGGDLSSLFFTKVDTGFIHMYGGNIVLVKADSFLHCTGIPGYFGSNYIPGTGSLKFLSQQNGFVAGGFGKFARTSDGGNSWQPFDGDTNIYVLCASMSDTSHGVIASVNGKVAVTTNGGVSWSPANSISQHPILDMSFVNNLKGYAVGGADTIEWQIPSGMSKGIIWKTEDGGYTWSVDDSSWNNQLTALFIVNDSLAYAVGYNGIIFKNSNLYYNEVAELNKVESNISISPNPATSEIKIENVKGNISSIEIFNTLGEKVYINGETSGNDVETINISALSSGIYFVRVKTKEGVSAGKFVKE
jgi:photosystem II stability/assembly factor-like uncharacterized protein